MGSAPILTPEKGCRWPDRDEAAFFITRSGQLHRGRSAELSFDHKVLFYQMGAALHDHGFRFNAAFTAPELEAILSALSVLEGNCLGEEPPRLHTDLHFGYPCHKVGHGSREAIRAMRTSNKSPFEVMTELPVYLKRVKNKAEWAAQVILDNRHHWMGKCVLISTHTVRAESIVSCLSEDPTVERLANPPHILDVGQMIKVVIGRNGEFVDQIYLQAP